MSVPKKQHYIPKFYLNGFCHKNRLWVYDRSENEFRQQTPINTTLLKHYYSFETEEGEIDTTVEKILYASSSETYGEPLQVPTPETHPILLNIHTNRDSYASSKAICEFYTKLFAREFKIKFLILRIFNTYGPHMDTSEYGQVIPEFINKMFKDKQFTIIGDGKHTRSFCYVSDHTRLVKKLAETVSNEIVNVGNDEETKIFDLAKMMHDLENKKFNPKYLPGREYDHKRRQPDITKLKKLINDSPKIPLEEGLRKTIDAFKKKN